MTPDTATDTPALLVCSVSIPQHVVYRSFPTETVVLNLNTGRYHGLNATAGRMLEQLERAACVREAALALADSYSHEQELIEHDLCDLCRTLLERGLIEVHGPAEP